MPRQALCEHMLYTKWPWYDEWKFDPETEQEMTKEAKNKIPLVANI